MGEAAVTFLLDQVKEVVIGYADLISGAEKEFDQLKIDLGLLKDFLKQTAKKKKDHLLSNLEKQIRDVIYEVEDTIDICLTNAIQAKDKNALKRRLNPKRVSLAKAVRSISEDKIQPLFKADNSFAKLKKIADEAEGREEPLTQSTGDTPIRQNRIVGFEKEEATLTRYLKEKTNKLDVISIVGIPGQGKTTLAWKVYHNEEIDFHFPTRIWVYISAVFNIRDVLLEILKKIIPSQDTSSLKDHELAHEVSACLKKMKFLLVLDDVWSVDAWNKIREVLPLENGEGKVLITTREKQVADNSRVYKEPHKLKFLDEGESWELLQYEAVGNLEDCPQELRDIGRIIAKKCDGVPLTIVVIGGILMDQLNQSPLTAVSEWQMVSESVSAALTDKEKAKRITDVVELSYRRLPDDLRDCFVYLGVFPEDYEIPAKMLCGLWISEGYVLPRKGKNLEESAEANMNDLISRNLLKVEKSNHMGRVKTCRVHDMIRAFCINICVDEKTCHEFKIPNKPTGGIFEPPLSEVQKSHRLCFRSDLSMFLAENPRGPHVRSFLCFYEQPVDLDPQYITVIPDNFPMLRILESKCIKFNQFPAKVTKLTHLRYLTLYIESLKILPEPITQLWNLQSLVVETKSRSLTMNANLWKMVRLRYLKTRAAIVLDDKWQGNAGENLHTLNRLAPESCTEAVSKKAKNLRTLGISGKLSNLFEAKDNFLGKLLRLEKLKMVNSVAYEQTPEDLLHRLPNQFPPYLKRLTLTNTFLSWHHMPTLAMIKSLEALKLKDNAFAGVSWQVDAYGFPNLLLLLIVNANLVRWEATDKAFPKLRFLVVKVCENLQDIPECLGAHLEKLEVERVGPSAVECAKKIEKAQMERPTGKYLAPLRVTIGPAASSETK